MTANTGYFFKNKISMLKNRTLSKCLKMHKVKTKILAKSQRSKGLANSLGKAKVTKR